MELVGLHSHIARVVAESDTAVALGSGDVPVLATPRLLAWVEAATVDAISGHLDPGATSVGTSIRLEHLAASAVGATVTLSAEVVAVDGRSVRFSVAAHDAADQTVATGEVTRAVVDRERFLARL